MMKILEEEKDSFKALLVGFDEGYANALVDKLLENKEIVFASAVYDHPTKRNPVLTVRGKGIKKEIAKAVKELDEISENFKQSLAKA
ncbi:MAG TPA: RpoL/Rpb11 RNA polymerase subunit family protein [Candidatus Norongarragalinales archaeon]|nr:RpoL/Rpb11 RNA polymerase subunit family protein [Candidatus Norongarragalinales archaeon]